MSHVFPFAVWPNPSSNLQTSTPVQDPLRPFLDIFFQMSWKPIKIGLPIRSTRSLSPTKPTQVERLRTTHDVRAAYLRRQDTVATPSGVYTFNRGRTNPQALPPTTQPSATSSQVVDHHIHQIVTCPSSPKQASVLPDLLTSEPGWSDSFPDPHELPKSPDVVKISKAKKQWIKWTTDIIPSLLQPYLHLLRVTDSLHNLHHDEQLPCTCEKLNLHRMSVTCLYFDCEPLYPTCTTVRSSSPHYGYLV